MPRHEWRCTDDLPFPRIGENTAVNREILLIFYLMKYEFLRFYTLLRYPRENKPDTTRIAAAGFYSDGSEDSVICYMCGLTLYGLVEGDDPLTLHLTFSLQCDFFRRNIYCNIRCFQGTALENNFLRMPGDEELTISNMINRGGNSTEIFLERHLASDNRMTDSHYESGIPYNNELDNSNTASLPDPFRLNERNVEGDNQYGINGNSDVAQEDLNVGLSSRVGRQVNDLRQSTEVVRSVNRRIISQPQIDFQVSVGSTESVRPNSECARVDRSSLQSPNSRAISVTAEKRKGKQHVHNIARSGSTKEAEEKCMVCKENIISYAFYHCGHTFCWTCAEAVEMCPTCGRKVNGSSENHH